MSPSSARPLCSPPSPRVGRLRPNTLRLTALAAMLWLHPGCQPQPTLVEYIPTTCERTPQAWRAGLRAEDPAAQGAASPAPPDEASDQAAHEPSHAPSHALPSQATPSHARPSAKPRVVTPSPTRTPPDAQLTAQASSAPPEPAAPAAADAHLIDLNHATSQELELLPGIGPAMAARIIEHRQRRPFQSVAQLRRVKGIGPAKFEALRTRVRVGHATPK